MYTVAGAGLYRFNGPEYQSIPGDITLYRPGSFHDYQFSPEARKWDLLWAHFTPKTEWMDWLDWPEAWPGLMRLHLDDADVRRRVALRLREMVASQFRAHPRKHLLGMNALEEVLLWCDSHNPRQTASRIDPRVRKAMDYLASHLGDPFEEERVAHAAGLSPSRMRHLFREQTGDSPRHYLEEQRLRRAKDLVALSRQTIGEIASELGFASPFYFSLRFKKHTGKSPRDFRTRAQEN
jgi:AraC family transcriptional regulator of arabinose operon